MKLIWRLRLLIWLFFWSALYIFLRQYYWSFWSVHITNPASTYCLETGGTSTLHTDQEGNTYGVCTLPDGTVCEEWALFHHECPYQTSSGTSEDQDFWSYIPLTGWTSSNSVTQTQHSSWEPKVCTMEYAPVCALVHVQCIKAPCPPIKQTFSNRCMMEANPLAEFLHTWTCENKEDKTSCPLWHPPAPGFCSWGTLIEPEPDEHGCLPPPTCILSWS